AADGFLSDAAVRGDVLRIACLARGRKGVSDGMNGHRSGSREPLHTVVALRALRSLRAGVARVALRALHGAGVRPRGSGPDIEVAGDEVGVPGGSRRGEVADRGDRADDLEAGADVALVTLVTLRALWALAALRTPLSRRAGGAGGTRRPGGAGRSCRPLRPPRAFEARPDLCGRLPAELQSVAGWFRRLCVLAQRDAARPPRR